MEEKNLYNKIKHASVTDSVTSLQPNKSVYSFYLRCSLIARQQAVKVTPILGLHYRIKLLWEDM